MSFLHHDGITFHYLDSGEGVPFIFQHGLGGDVTQPYGLFTPPLPFRLLSFDFRGHGETRPPAAWDQPRESFAVTFCWPGYSREAG
jgi:pimeloyl-ACP methyl ester carboxylesterase